MLLNFAVLIALLQGMPLDLTELKAQFMAEPQELAQRYYDHPKLPANTGSAQFYQLTLRAAIVSNQPQLANDIAQKLTQPIWQPYIENHHAKLVSNMGVLLRINGRYEDAMKAYQCALALNNGDKNFSFHTLLNLQSAMLHAKQYDKAKDMLDKAAKLATNEQQHLRVKINVANHFLDTNNLYKARALFKELYRDLSLAGETETAARVGLNLLNTEILLSDYSQFWRYQNSVRQSIFSIAGSNHHYYYHFVIMRSFVNAMQAPNNIQHTRFAYAIEHGRFLFEYGQQASIGRYVNMLNVPWISAQFTKQVADYQKVRPKKFVPMALLEQHCNVKTVAQHHSGLL
ncbi:tetratricopeptide repeat protein [Pseudoalteromonas sp. JBTF-M23]|uniref:Tetratricopeptide repeat protein n=1 Tax=Pseudoalteromonas caenipelagi TaxID=2726988 RepID=A0A849VFN0_9GAMM|nr:tetratricopeptide repeat protein [Pseudoalteromonas caenipelagi]NOU52222.1 tetratricopeptide repeat protein [Pseudoalteromonas caenipelagi]